MERFIVEWGYWAVLLGCFFEGETILVFAGMLAHRGVLRLDWVCAIACLGSVLGDQTWFLLGRFAGERLGRHFHFVQAATERLERWMTRYGAWFVFGFRFLYGIRTVTPLFLGMSRFPVRKFIAFNVLGAVVWSVAVGSLGWSIGVAVQHFLGRAAKIEELVLLIFGMAALIWAIHRSRRHR